MTGRRDFLRSLASAAAVLAVGAVPVLAQDVGADIARQLRRRGYEEIEISRTLLGRVRVVGRRGNVRREVIVNPNSGEILRDLTTDSRTGAASSSLLGDEGDRSGGNADREGSSNSGRGNQADRRDGRDDDSSGGAESNSGRGGSGGRDDDRSGSGGGDDEGSDDD